MTHVDNRDDFIIRCGGKDVLNIYHNVLKSIVMQEHPLSRLPIIGKFFDRILAPADHQLVVHIFGTPAQLKEQEDAFMRQCELFVNGLNSKECKKDKKGNIVRPKFFCNAFQIIEKPRCFQFGNVQILKEPNVLRW